nr:MAG TPA: hypothetical protein [Caudoviricetes sp.]
MLKEHDIIGVEYEENAIEIVYALQEQVNRMKITKNNKELFNYLIKFKSEIPYTNVSNAFKDDNNSPHLNKYINESCNDETWENIYIQLYKQPNKIYIIRCTMNTNYIVRMASLDLLDPYKSVREICLDNWCFYNLTLGKELATIACVLDMPPEIACLLKEV